MQTSGMKLETQINFILVTSKASELFTIDTLTCWKNFAPVSLKMDDYTVHQISEEFRSLWFCFLKG